MLVAVLLLSPALLCLAAAQEPPGHHGHHAERPGSADTDDDMAIGASSSPALAPTVAAPTQDPHDLHPPGDVFFWDEDHTRRGLAFGGVLALFADDVRNNDSDVLRWVDVSRSPPSQQHQQHQRHNCLKDRTPARAHPPTHYTHTGCL